MCQTVFYKGGELQVSDDLKLVCNNPGTVILKMKDGKITEISAADPNRELTKFNLSVTAKIENSGENFETFWDENRGKTNISIELPQDNYAGDSVTIKL